MSQNGVVKMYNKQTTILCIVSGFLGALIATACGVPEGGKVAHAEDEMVFTKRIVECSYDDWINGLISGVGDVANDVCGADLDGDELVTEHGIKNGARDASCINNQDCDTLRYVILE